MEKDKLIDVLHTSDKPVLVNWPLGSGIVHDLQKEFEKTHRHVYSLDVSQVAQLITNPSHDLNWEKSLLIIEDIALLEAEDQTTLFNSILSLKNEYDMKVVFFIDDTTHIDELLFDQSEVLFQHYAKNKNEINERLQQIREQAMSYAELDRILDFKP